MDMGEVVAGAAKGAAVGSVVPGIGTALGAVGGVVLTMAPEIGRWLFGPDAAPAVSAVQAAVGAVTGSTDPEQQVAALGDPDKAAALRVELARIAAEREAAAAEAGQTALVARLADVAGARTTTVQLAQVGSSIAWGAPVVSVVVLLTFGGVVAMTLVRAMPPGAEAVLNVLLGTLGAMATSVVSYWVGSSAGSARKDARLASLADRLPGPG